MLGRKNSGASPAHTDRRTDETVDMAKDRPAEGRTVEGRTVEDRTVEDRTVRDRPADNRDVADHDRAAPVAAPTSMAHRGHREAKDRFGGFNWGAGFFGWLVAIGVAILLTGIISAVATAVGSNANWTQTEAERQAGTIGLAAGIALVVVLTIAYFVGGYVAGRMSRFDGGKQGLATWLIGLLITLVAVGLGALFGNEYNVLERIEFPNISLTGDEISWGATITGLAAIVLTLLGAMMGGKVGHRYHDKVDRVAHR